MTSKRVFINDSTFSGKTICLKASDSMTEKQLIQAALEQLRLPSTLQASLVHDGKFLTDQASCQEHQVMTLVCGSLVGGAFTRKGRRRSGLVNDSGEDDDGDDQYERVAESNQNKVSNSGSGLLDRVLGDYDREITRAEELLDISADDLAAMVKDREDPTKLNLGHSVFKQPRRYWEKMLTSPKL